MPLHFHKAIETNVEMIVNKPSPTVEEHATQERNSRGKKHVKKKKKS
jgi:hypothetical protein